MKKLRKEIAPHFKKFSKEHQETALAIREKVFSIIPEAKEIIKYGMPTYQWNGNDICGILINKGHIGFYPYSGSLIAKFPEINKKYSTTKGSIHVPIGESISRALLSKIIRAKVSSCSVSKGEIDLEKYNKLDKVWRELGLAAPARRALVDKKILRMTDLKKVRLKELSALHGMGPSAIKILKKSLKEAKLDFKK